MLCLRSCPKPCSAATPEASPFPAGAPERATEEGACVNSTAIDPGNLVQKEEEDQRRRYQRSLYQRSLYQRSRYHRCRVSTHAYLEGEQGRRGARTRPARLAIVHVLESRDDDEAVGHHGRRILSELSTTGQLCQCNEGSSKAQGAAAMCGS